MSAARTADTVVVGAGSAGAVAAAILARTRRVLLVEAGPVTAPPPAVTRLTALPLGPGDRVTRYPERRGRDVVRGRGLGGSAAINGGYFLRGHRADYAAWPWTAAEIDAAFAAIEPPMRVTGFVDAELGEVARAFEAYWGAPARDPWPVIGVNRVRSNRVAGHRRTTAEAFGRVGVTTMRARVTGLAERGGRVTGVHTDRGRIDAGEVVLAAGTLGTAALLVPILGPLTPHEHPERLVRFTPRIPLPAVPLLQTVLHTADGLELRPYGGDFADYLPGLPRSGVAIGVADMTRATAGRIAPADGCALDLGEPDPESRARLAAGVEEVVAMLTSGAFAHLVEPGSIAVDPVIGMSSHAWGTLPLGTGVDSAGAPPGTVGLRVVDASVLPGPLRSGPHATVVLTAALLARRH